MHFPDENIWIRLMKKKAWPAVIRVSKVCWLEKRQALAFKENVLEQERIIQATLVPFQSGRSPWARRRIYSKDYTCELGRIMTRPSPYRILLGLLPLWTACASSTHKCTVTHDIADCSHQKLTQVPDDLPTNIAVLNLTHNQFRGLPPANFTRYSKLTVLDGGFNSISKLEPELCQSLPLLKVLNLQHNELSHLSDKTFMFCINLTELYLISNSIQKIQNNPFKNQKVKWKCLFLSKKCKLHYLMLSFEVTFSPFY